MKFFAIFLVLVLFQISNAQTDNSFTVDSAVLDGPQKVFVYLPKDYETSQKRYPVVYLTDAEFNFSFSSDAAKILTQWTSRMPASIVIGITSTNRERDLTTLPSKNWQPPQPIPGAGGADKFLKYVQTELIPFVETKYRTAPLRTLIGHSLGGLFALYTMTAAPDLFRFYILLDASIWWDDGVVAKSAMAYLTKNPNYSGRLIWIRDKIPREVWFPINAEWLNYLQNKRPSGLAFRFIELENETHSSLVYPGTYIGLREIFSDFAFTFDEKTDLKSVKAYYAKLNVDYGFEVPIPDNVFDNLCGQLIYLKKFTEAIEAGQMWTKSSPNSSSAFQNLGRAYLETGDKALAKVNLTRSVELDPKNDEAQKLLKTLGGN